jgi:predicted methyltransferase
MPTMTVVEVWSGDEIWTEILGPHLKGSGHYDAGETVPRLAPQRRQRMLSSSRRVPALRRALRSKGETMNKKLIIAWIVLFVAWFMGSFVVHGVLLRSDYMQLTNLFRAEGDQQKYFTRRRGQISIRPMSEDIGC